MSEKNDPNQDNPALTAQPIADTTADIEQQRRDEQSRFREAERKHLQNLRTKGYVSGTEKRRVRSDAHGRFLMRAGEPGAQPR